MKTTKTAVNKLGIIPRLHLYEKITDERGKSMGVKSTGPHRVKFISDRSVMGKDPMTMKERQEIEFIVEENGVRKTWKVPLLNKENKPNYLLEKLSEIEENEEVILEGKKSGPKNFTSIARLNQTEVENEGEDGLPSDEVIDEVLKEEAQKLQ